MKARDYQVKAREAVFEAWKENNSTLVVMPTGTGKTVLFADVIRHVHPLRSMVVAHREELIWQARDKIQRVTNLDTEIEMAEMSISPGLFADSPVIITTVQTMNSQNGDLKRMGKFSPNKFGLLIIDEAHHAVAKTYQNIINYMTQNPGLRVLGVTATPDRADEEALGQVFKSVAFDYEILDAIHDGWLVPITQQLVHVTDLDFSHIRTTAGDLNGADLAAVMEAESNLQGVAGSLCQIMGDRKTLVFTVSVKQAEVMSEIFNRFKPGCSTWVCGETPKDIRRQVVSDYAAGKFQVVCNCDCFTEGFDDPAVEVVAMARPTKSRAKYAQMCGRSMRPLPGIVDGLENSEERREAIAGSPKPECLIVDFVGNSGKHKLMSSADILGGNVSEEAINRAVIRARNSGIPVRMSDLLDEEQQKIIQEAEERRKMEAARRARLVANVKFNTKSINPFDVLQLDHPVVRGWDRGKSLSEKQRNLLMKQGVDPDSMNYTEAKAAINEMFRRWNNDLCSLKQANVLNRYGYETKNLSRKAASELMDRLKANNWRRIDGGEKSVR